MMIWTVDAILLASYRLARMADGLELRVSAGGLLTGHEVVNECSIIGLEGSKMTHL